jgi:hypothetical protein
MIVSRYDLLQAMMIEKKRTCRQMVRGNLTKLVVVEKGNGRDQLKLMVLSVVILRRSQTSHAIGGGFDLDCMLV